MALSKRVRCATCGWDVKQARLGLTEQGAYDAAKAPQHELSVRIDDIGGRGHLVVTREPLPLPFARGMRDALKAALARVEAEIAEALGEDAA